MTHEAQLLHLRYGLVIALSTLNSSRYLNEPKTRFPVGRLFPLPGRELHPLKAPGLSWRTKHSSKGRVADNPGAIQKLALKATGTAFHIKAISSSVSICL
jgi:hypothetical protein